MQFQTLADAGRERQPAPPPRPGAPPKRAKSHSPQRVLHERLKLNNVSPVGCRVAQVLQAYTHAELTGRGLFASVYHSKIAAETGLSLSSVRRGLRELTGGDAPLYMARGTTGQARKLRGRGGFELTTTSPKYEWIDDLPAFLAARDTGRAVKLLEFEERKAQAHPDKVQLQAQLLTDKIDKATYDAAVEQIDAKARGNIPARAVLDARPSRRCLTLKQVSRYGALIARWPNPATLEREGVNVNKRELYALREHVNGAVESNGGGCQHCQDAVIAQWRQAKVHPGSGQTGQDWLKAMRLEQVRCGCGEPVVRSGRTQAVPFWDIASGVEARAHDCIHEQNRLLKLRTGGHR